MSEPDLSSMLEGVIRQQKATNQLLGQLVEINLAIAEALSSDDDEGDAEPHTYMDGTPRN